MLSGRKSYKCIQDKVTANRHLTNIESIIMILGQVLQSVDPVSYRCNSASHQYQHVCDYPTKIKQPPAVKQ